MSDIEWTHFSDGAHMMSRHEYTVECRYIAVRIYHDITYDVAKTAAERKPDFIFSLPGELWGVYSLQWRHNERHSVSNHQPHHCLLNRWFMSWSKKTSKFCVTAFCVYRWPINSPHKWPLTRKMFPFADVIMYENLEKTDSVITAPHCIRGGGGGGTSTWTVNSTFTRPSYDI